MKILKMRIENFKGIQNKEYDLTPTVVAVLGNNGTGKTSLLDAFNRVYTGQLADIHARTGASTAVIEAYLDNGARISHIRKTQKVLKNPVTEHRLDGKKKTLDEIRLYMEQYFATQAETLSVLSSATMLQEMEPASLSKFLMKHLQIKITGEKLIHILQEHIGIEDYENLFKQYIKPEEDYNQQKLEQLYERISGERLPSSREIKSLTAYTNNYNGYIPNEGRTATFLQDEIMNLLKLISSVEEQEKTLRSRQKIQNSIQKCRERMDVVKSEFYAIQADRPDGSDVQLKENLGKLEDEIRLLQDNIIRTNSNMEIQRSTLAAIEKGRCPIYEEMNCSVDWSQLLKEIRHNISEGEKLVQKNQKAKEEKEKDQKALYLMLEKYNENLKLYEKKSQLYAEYNNLKSNMPKLEDVPEIKKEEIPNIGELKGRLASLQREKKMLDEYGMFQEKQRILEEVKKINVQYDALCKALDPKGTVFQHLMNQQIAAMEQLCNRTAKRYRSGFELKLHMGQGLHVYCRPRAESPLVEFKNASSGEKACIMLSLVDMICELSGSRIMALDDLEKLDSEMLEAVFSIVTDSSFYERYDHIMLAGVSHYELVEACRKYKIQIVC